jgi:hypothetical protein
MSGDINRDKSRKLSTTAEEMKNDEIHILTIKVVKTAYVADKIDHN